MSSNESGPADEHVSDDHGSVDDSQGVKIDIEAELKQVKAALEGLQGGIVAKKIQQFCKTLGVEESELNEDLKEKKNARVRKQYIKLMHTLHPDQHATDQAKVSKINEAYGVLTDQRKQLQYFRDLLGSMNMERVRQQYASEAPERELRRFLAEVDRERAAKIAEEKKRSDLAAKERAEEKKSSDASQTNTAYRQMRPKLQESEKYYQAGDFSAAAGAAKEALDVLLKSPQQLASLEEFAAVNRTLVIAADCYYQLKQYKDIVSLSEQAEAWLKRFAVEIEAAKKIMRVGIIRVGDAPELHAMIGDVARFQYLAGRAQWQLGKPEEAAPLLAAAVATSNMRHNWKNDEADSARKYADASTKAVRVAQELKKLKDSKDSEKKYEIKDGEVVPAAASSRLKH